MSVGTADAVAAEPVQVSFWYPVDLGGGLAKAIDSLVGDFNKGHPEIQVTATYTGNYDVTLQKIQASKLAGTLPDVATRAGLWSAHQSRAFRR